MDFGYALVKLNGRLAKVAFFVMVLPYSDAAFVMAFERECTETFWEGHVRAAYSDQNGHRFRFSPDTDSGGCRTVIPILTGQHSRSEATLRFVK